MKSCKFSRVVATVVGLVPSVLTSADAQSSGALNIDDNNSSLLTGVRLKSFLEARKATPPP
jgi:hypothetical protein